MTATKGQVARRLAKIVRDPSAPGAPRILKSIAYSPHAGDVANLAAVVAAAQERRAAARKREMNAAAKSAAVNKSREASLASEALALLGGSGKAWKAKVRKGDPAVSRNTKRLLELGNQLRRVRDPRPGIRWDSPSRQDFGTWLQDLVYWSEDQ